MKKQENEKFPRYSIDELIEIFTSHATEYHSNYKPDQFEDSKLNEYFNIAAAFVSFCNEIKSLKSSGISK